jgi:2'-5' RNA ligase
VTSGLSGLLPLRIRLGPVVTFVRRRVVLARLVVADADLLALHAAAVRASGAEPTPFTRPGEWTPHVTLARGLSVEEAGEALSLFGPFAVESSAVTLRRWNSVTRQVRHLVG